MVLKDYIIKISYCILYLVFHTKWLRVDGYFNTSSIHIATA